MFGAPRRDLLLEGIQTRKEEAIEPISANCCWAIF